MMIKLLVVLLLVRWAQLLPFFFFFFVLLGRIICSVWLMLDEIFQVNYYVSTAKRKVLIQYSWNYISYTGLNRIKRVKILIR